MTERDKLIDELIAAHKVIGLDKKWHARQIAARKSLVAYIEQRTLTDIECQHILTKIEASYPKGGCGVCDSITEKLPRLPSTETPK